MFIAIGLSLYSLRRIRIIRAVGNMKNDDSAFRVVYKRVNSFKFEPSNKNDRGTMPSQLQQSKAM